MGFLQNIFKRKENPIQSYVEFWNWFAANADTFFTVVKVGAEVENQFFRKLTPKLNELKSGFWFLTGMYTADTAELVLTADGAIHNIVFVEELVAAAPQIPNWKITALKPALDIKDVSINMSIFSFHRGNMHFYANENAAYPDEIDITIVHDDCTEANKETIANGCYIFLDNFLGELDFVVNIDNLEIKGPKDAKAALIAIEKLKDYLTWRQKEFIEKYEGSRHDTANDKFSVLEANYQNGDRLVAIVNTDILSWDSKASHPWILVVEIPYNGTRQNGMPSENDMPLLEEIEQKFTGSLHYKDGYLYIGRQTAQNKREIYFACKEFRRPSKLAYELQKEYHGKVEIAFEIYKDKYWRSFSRFQPEL